MKKSTGKTYEEYKVYAKKRRNKSIICRTYDKAFIEYKQKHNDIPMINGGIMSYESNDPYMYFCTIGDGFVEDSKTYMTSNYYEVEFYSGIKGCTIYKAMNNSIHYKCFTCGGSVDMFGRNHWSAGCRVYEDLEVEEIVKKLINKDWKTFYNVKHNKNKPNYMFLKQMKQRLIKTLVYNKIIYKLKNGTYEDYKYYGLIE